MSNMGTMINSVYEVTSRMCTDVVGVIPISIAILTFFISYFLFWRPFNLERDFSDFGYHKSTFCGGNNHKARDGANDMNRLRKLGSLPPAFPNGWFAILESSQLPKKGVKEVNCLGLNLVVWRSECGKAVVADTYCPHLGANLAVGGNVKGDCIECPFHGWQFNTEGYIGYIPYSDTNVQSLQDVGKLKVWESIETNGFIYLWYHAENDKPTWFPQTISQVDSGEWRYRGRSEFTVACHIQEIQENGADVSHLNIVHRPAMLEGGSPAESILKWSFLKHTWSAKWEASQENGSTHKALMTVSHDMNILGKLSFMKMTVKAHQVGPGTVHLIFKGFGGIGVLFFMVTPIKPLLQRITHTFYSSSSMLHPFGMLILLGEAIQLQRDIAIWNRKTYLHRPLLVTEDKTIKTYRRWYSQFYSENSSKTVYEHYAQDDW